MKIIILLFFLVICLSAKGQIVTESEFKQYQGTELIYKKNKIDYTQSALKLKDLYDLDKNNAISRSVIIDSIQKSKSEIHIEVNNWFVHSFNDGKSVIQINDKDAGSVIGKGYISNISYNIVDGTTIDTWIIIRIDIKEGKLRITTTIQDYEAVIGGEVFKWLPSDYFPFKNNSYKKTTAKAFVNSHIWSQLIILKIKNAVLNGITEKDDNW